jgi:hypothetical protein
MPARCPIDPLLLALIREQDFVVTRAQAVGAGMTRHALSNVKTYDGWQKLLPNVYLCHPGEPSRRQMMVAALFYAGRGAAIDDVDACRFHGITNAQVDDDVVRVAVPVDSRARSVAFVRIRRASDSFAFVQTRHLRYVSPAPAVIAAARRRTTERGVLALLSDALQRRIVTFDELMAAHVQAPPQNAAFADRALESLGAGIQSAPEADFRNLALASIVLPQLLYNRLLRLPSGRVVSPDALCVEAALVHETNGRRPHEREDLFEDMQERHSVMTAAGLTALHSTPRQIRASGRLVIAHFERCYLRDVGKGLPPGVELLPPR